MDLPPPEKRHKPDEPDSSLPEFQPKDGSTYYLGDVKDEPLISGYTFPSINTFFGSADPSTSANLVSEPNRTSEEYNDEYVDGDSVDDGQILTQLLQTGKTALKGRARKQAEIQVGLATGEIREVVSCNAFFKFIDKYGVEIDRLRCRKCLRILSAKSGGHKTIHRNQECLRPATLRNSTAEESKKVDEAVVEYAVRSGVSFSHTSSEAFEILVRELVSIGGATFDPKTLTHPADDVMKKSAEDKAKEHRKAIGDMIRKPIQLQEACLVIDFGKKLHNFLSIFVVFIDREKGTPTLKSVPFLFSPIHVSRSAENICNLIVAAGEKFGVFEDGLRNLRVIVDSDADIKKLDKYFKSYSLCSSQNLQEAAGRSVDPLPEHHQQFEEDELKLLNSLNESIDICSDIAALLHRKQEKFKLPKLPTAYCHNKWLTFENCVPDVLAMLTDIESLNDLTINRLIERLKPNQLILMTAISILKSFKIPLKLYEGTGSKLHEMAPCLFNLKRMFEQEEARGLKMDDFTLQTVAKSAKIALNHYIETTVGNPNLLATLLCPGMRNLKTFPPEFKQRALKLIMDELNRVIIESPETAVTPFNLMSSIYDDCDPAQTAQEEFESYDRMHLTGNDREITPLEFWTKYSDRFPRISKVATRIFCVLPSEVCCESAFTALNNLFISDSQRSDPEWVETMMTSFVFLNNFT